MKRVTFHLMAFLAFIAIAANSASLASAQSIEGTANVRFEIDISRLKDSKLLQNVPVGDLLAPAMANVPPDAQDVINNLEKISGVVMLPEAVGDVESAAVENRLPMDFAIMMEFADKDSMETVFKQMSEEGAEFDSEKGLYYPEAQSAPEGAAFKKVNETTLAAGSIEYLTSANLDSLTSKAASARWTDLNASPIRIVIDTTNRKDLMAEIQAAAQDNAPPQALAFIMLIEKIAGLSLALDLDNNEMIDLRLSGFDDEGTQSLHDGVEGLLGMAKMFGGAGLEDMKESNPDMHAVAKGLLDQLQSKLEGKNVKLLITKPEKFDEVMAGAMQAGR